MHGLLTATNLLGEQGRRYTINGFGTQHKLLNVVLFVLTKKCLHPILQQICDGGINHCVKYQNFPDPFGDGTFLCDLSAVTGAD